MSTSSDTFHLQCSACLRLSASTTTRARATMGRPGSATRRPSAPAWEAPPLETAPWASESAVAVSITSLLAREHLILQGKKLFSKMPLYLNFFNVLVVGA